MGAGYVRRGHGVRVKVGTIWTKKRDEFRVIDNVGTKDATRVLDVERITVETDRGAYREIHVRAGRVKTERVENRYVSTERDVWPVDVSVLVSPTGRSVRVWINHQEIEL